MKVHRKESRRRSLFRAEPDIVTRRDHMTLIKQDILEKAKEWNAACLD